MASPASVTSYRSDRVRWIAKKTARCILAVASGFFTASKIGTLARIHSVRVITYHRFGSATRDPFCVHPEAFEQQMSWLASQRLAVSLSDVEAFLDGQRDFPEGGVLVTIDDADQSVYSHALPVLRRHNIPAVLFVIAGQVGQPGFVSHQQLEAIAAAGVVIGSHTMTHPNLATLAPDATREELQRSKESLEEQLSSEIRVFAYPFGTRQAFDESTAALVAQSGYRLAFTSQHGPLRPGSDRMALPRVKVEGGDPPWLFRGLCRGSLDGWRWVDRWLWRLQKPLPSRLEPTSPLSSP